MGGSASHELSTTEENRRLTMKMRRDELIKKTEIEESGNSVLIEEDRTDNGYGSSMLQKVT